MPRDNEQKLRKLRILSKRLDRTIENPTARRLPCTR
jgi:hypothetical protein